MKLTKEVISKFIELAENKEVVTVKGVNGLGQQFETKGLLLAKYKGDVLYYANNHCFALDLGQSTEDGKYINFVSVYTEFDDDPDVLIALNLLDSSGEAVFINEDAEKIEKSTKSLAKKYNSEFKHLTRNGKVAVSYIAKPVIVTTGTREDKVAIKNVCHIANGSDALSCTTGFVMLSLPLYEGSEIRLDQDAIKKLENVNQGSEERE